MVRNLRREATQFKYQLLIGLICLAILQLLSIRGLDLSQYIPNLTDLDYFPPPSFEVLHPFLHATLSNATLAHLSNLELQVTKLHNQKATSCRSPRGAALCQRNATLVWFNPSNRDKFICNGNILLGPGKTLVATTPQERGNGCWDNAWTMSMTSRSFPREATVENKGLFPGISVKKQSTQPIDDTFSSNLERLTFPHDDLIQAHNLYKPNASMGLVYKMQGGNRREKPGEFGPLRCDIKCEYESGAGLINQQWVYGTNWQFHVGIEGSHYYPNLAIHDDDWKKNKYFMTTSFKSEVPASYFSLYNNWWGSTLKSPAVDYNKVIKGASFLARNCGAKNNRNDVVKKLIAAGFRVDSLSSCLKNADPPPGANMQNKTNVMEKYMFHLAFENGRVDDYVTEKLWMAFHSGTLPVLLGPDASNIREHVGSLNGAIYVDDYRTVDDLAKYLIEVSNNQTLYESYHAWRKEPYPEKFLAKYNFTYVHNTCRLCRWAFAKKYGLGFNHTKQTLEPVKLSRKICIESNAMNTPVSESWWDGSGGLRRKLDISPSSANEGLSSCHITNGTLVSAKIGSDNLIRSIWSHDGTTDMYLEGQLAKPVVLKLQLPITHSLGSNQVYDKNTVWFQTEQSRISLVFSAEGPGALDLNSASIITVTPNSAEVAVDPGYLPMRIRIILEDQDIHHKGASEEPTYYGKIMTDDVLSMPELFVLGT
ncbi:hypothetical protein ACHAXN_003623 [Cyclotella atomus]